MPDNTSWLALVLKPNYQLSTKDFGENTVQQAALLGSRASSPGLAFAAGLQAALSRFGPELPRPLALAATEAGGAHPKHIQTHWDGESLCGTKTFVSMGAAARTLVVIARLDEQRLGAFAVDSKASGVYFEANPPLPIAPEVTHERLILDHAPAVQLPGDGYRDYLKSFRTLEDLHVAAALTGLFLQESLELSKKEQLLGLLAGLESLSRLPPLDAGVHLALSGIYQNMIALFDIEALPESPHKALWQRDVALFRVAGNVREKRREAAWRAF